MPNATITTLVGQIATVSLSSTPVSNYQDELILELARMAMPGVIPQVGASFVAVTATDAEYTLPAGDTMRTLLMVFYDDNQLALAGYEELQYIDSSWRTEVGTPVAFTVETFERSKFAIVPPPTFAGATIGGNTPTSVTAWPQGNLTIIGTTSDLTYADTSLVDTYLPMAFTVLAREMSRDSDHIDPELSAAANQMASFLWQMSFPEGTS